MSASLTISVLLDGRRHVVPADARLAWLVADLGHAPEAVATAVNGCFVARARREAWHLKAGDAVVLFQPIVGG